ncbi:hypothetical protein BGZ76_007255 [Entomortierella beljakovae]|nr:hypothetical protein BGZ76_007255 [Entomortierella beljakovae]
MSPPQTARTPIFETSTRATVDASTTSNTPVVINASVKCKTGVCIGEFVAIHINIDNQSQTDLQSIHLALVRQISYATDRNGSNYTYSTTNSTTIHNATIPVAKVINASSTWSQQLQFKMPSNLGLIPSISSSVTPLLKVNYFIMISIPIPQYFNGFVRRLKPGTRKRSYHDLSILDNPISHSPLSGLHDQSLLAKNLMVVQITPIPIILGTIPSHNQNWRFKRPIPNYLEVTDRPKFIRDRFEEEMIKQLSSLESLIIEEEDGDEDIDELILEAQRNSSSEESEYENEKSRSRVPERFRTNRRRVTFTDDPLPIANIGLGTPPPSPPQDPISIAEDILSVQAISDPPPSFTRHMYDAHGDGGTSSHRSNGLARNLLLAMHNSSRT